MSEFKFWEKLSVEQQKAIAKNIHEIRIQALRYAMNERERNHDKYINASDYYAWFMAGIDTYFNLTEFGFNDIMIKDMLHKPYEERA